MVNKLVILVGILILISCQKGKESELPFEENLPSKEHPMVNHPEGNESLEERLILGKLLFYDPILSVDSTVSCNSCHIQKYAFADNKAISPGVLGRLGNRNAPSLANVAFQPYYTREGGVPTLEQHVLVPIQEEAEMAFNLIEAAQRLAQDSLYRSLCAKAYPGKPIYFAITASLAQFQRSMLSFGSPFDDYLYNNNQKALSAEARRGMALFYSNKTDCYQCHSGPNFTSYAFENNGLYTDYEDKGRYRFSKMISDFEKFKIPSLRNVSLTKPYMHDGSISRLDLVVEHYNQGGALNDNKSPLIRPLQLTKQEKLDLVSFLSALTDRAFIENLEFKK